MAYGITIRRRVEFCETDMMGIVHFSNFFRYAEAAETAFFRSLELQIMNCGVGWPRVHAEFDFKQPLRFEDEIEISLLVQERRSRSLVYAISVEKAEVVVARGKVVVACVQQDPATGAMVATVIPEEIAARIEAAPPELLAELMRTPPLA